MIHVTWLSAFNACPYLSSQPMQPLHPEKTYRWDMLNVVVCSWDETLISPFVKRFAKNIGFDFKEIEITKLIYQEAKKKIIDIKSKHKQVYQEAKMYYKYSEEYFVCGTPDIFFYDEEKQLWCIRDWKFSTHSRYWNEDVTKTDMQKVIYPLMVMQYMEVQEAEFAFRCYDKKTWKLGEFASKITYDEAKKQADKVIAEYIMSKEFGEFEPRACNKCHGMCSVGMKNCPLYKTEVSSEKKDEEIWDF